jgi:hypothetical protein
MQKAGMLDIPAFCIFHPLGLKLERREEPQPLTIDKADIGLDDIYIELSFSIPNGGTMKTSKLARVPVLFLGCFFALALSVSAASNTAPPLPGITAADDRPKGCVDCHINAGGKDFRLTVVLNSLKDGHPEVVKTVKNVPVDCLKCHFASAKAPVLGSMVHRNHYSNAVNNAFLNEDKGSCLACHTVDTKSGKIAIKNAPANW